MAQNEKCLKYAPKLWRTNEANTSIHRQKTTEVYLQTTFVAWNFLLLVGLLAKRHFQKFRAGRNQTQEYQKRIDKTSK